MFSRKLFLLLVVITSELIIFQIDGAPATPSLDLTEVLIFDSDSRSVEPSKQNASDPTKNLVIPSITENDAEKFLKNLGYNDVQPDGLDVSNRLGFGDVSSLWDRIRIFQRDNGLEETGVLDDETKITMGSPHCGTRVAEKRGDVAKWNKNTLTYRIRDVASGAEPSKVNALVKRAFNEWSKVTNLNFVEKNDPNVDIEVNFGGENHQRRGRRCTFDDPNTMAHAFYPEGGDVHFNRKYFFDDGENMDVFLDTAIHEIGHSLGLEHSSSKGSIMHATEMNRFTEPQPEDVKRIQALYGVRRRGRVITDRAPKLCSLTKYDAALDDEQGNWYIFSGNHYYHLKEKNPSGKLISSKWPGITGNIDAAFRYPDGRTYFFKGNRFWRFQGSRLESGYPRLISSGFPGLPNDVDGAFVDSKKRVFALKGNRYWVYDSDADSVPSYPLSGQGLPSNIDAAVGTSQNFVVFKGRDMYQFVNRKFKASKNPLMSC